MKLLGIKYQGCVSDPKTLLYGYYNTDFIGNRSMQKSILENIYLLKRQQTVAQSTAKAKYYTLAKAVSEALQLKQIIG